MSWSVLCSDRNARQSKQVVKERQGKSSRIVKTADRGGFGPRLREAFEGVSNAEIARRLKRSEPAIKNYIDGRIPTADGLVSIAHLTGCSVHWLLTGEGPKYVVDVEASSGPLFAIGPAQESPKLTPAERKLIATLISVLERSLEGE